MAKDKEVKKPAYPSPYGSHKVMVDADKTKELNKPGRVICKDDKGFYETDEKLLDSGMADVNRYKWRGDEE